MSSLLKSVLMLQKSIIPPQAGMPHAMNPNVLEILGDNSNIVIPTQPTEFKSVDGKPKRILINNFDAAASPPFLFSPCAVFVLDKTSKLILFSYLPRAVMQASSLKSISQI
jgi:hypothetical protein